MKERKNLQLAILLIISLITACERSIDTSEELTYNNSDDKNSEYYENESDYSYDADSATIIVMNGDEVSIDGTGASFSSNQVIIDTLGTYILKGELDNGSILVSAGESDLVKLILENISITCKDNSAIMVEQAGRTVILLPENTNNEVADGSTYSSDESNATIYSKSDLVISGEGSLRVTANYNDGITGKDGLIINSGTFEISAVDDGIRGKDYLVISSGVFTINSGGDGIISDNEDSDCGYIDIYQGSFQLTCKGDGLFAANELYIESGNFDLFCASGYNSGKALKAGQLLSVAGGNFILESVDDAIHSDAEITIDGGNFTISTNDDALHAETSLIINYAEINISGSYEGLEAQSITVEDGIIRLISSDDGINASDGSGDMMGGFSTSSNCNVYINGGIIAMYSSGDGLDSNGNIKMTGGTVLVHGPVSDGNGAIDYNGTFNITGGTLIAAGSSGMAEAPSSSSSQNSVLINMTSSKSAGTLFNLQDDSGNTIITFQPSKSYESVAVSSPLLKLGNTYSAYTGGSDSGTSQYGYYSGGTYTPGSLYQSFTQSSTTTTIGSTFGGGGGGRPGMMP